MLELEEEDDEPEEAVGELLPDEEALLFLLMNWKSIASVGYGMNETLPMRVR